MHSAQALPRGSAPLTPVELGPVGRPRQSCRRYLPASLLLLQLLAIVRGDDGCDHELERCYLWRSGRVCCYVLLCLWKTCLRWTGCLGEAGSLSAAFMDWRIIGTGMIWEKGQWKDSVMLDRLS